MASSPELHRARLDRVVEPSFDYVLAFPGLEVK
jgi:hypothetical protein